MAFATLLDASVGCLNTTFTRWNAGTLKTNLTAFNATCSALFADDNPNDRTVGNWLIPLQSLTTQLSSVFNESDYVTFTAINAILYRLFSQASARTPLQISVTQANAVLAAANANLD